MTRKHVFSAVCDRYFGPERNFLGNDKCVSKLDYTDYSVCKYYLVGLCPHELFLNTRNSLGACPRVHNETVKRLFESSSDNTYHKRQYQVQLRNFLIRIIRQLETRIARAESRIRADKDEVLLSDQNRERISEIRDEVVNTLQKAELAAENGDVDLAAQLNNKAVALNQEIEKISSQSGGLMMQRENDLRVCYICGAMQSVGDMMARFESHVSGKQHIGFEKMRSFLKELNGILNEDNSNNSNSMSTLGHHSGERRYYNNPKPMNDQYSNRYSRHDQNNDYEYSSRNNNMNNSKFDKTRNYKENHRYNSNNNHYDSTNKTYGHRYLTSAGPYAQYSNNVNKPPRITTFTDHNIPSQRQASFSVNQFYYDNTDNSIATTINLNNSFSNDRKNYNVKPNVNDRGEPCNRQLDREELEEGEC